MKLGNIEVSGIRRLVFVREKTVWTRYVDVEGCTYWTKDYEEGSSGFAFKTDGTMIKTINHFIEHGRVRVHNETVNIYTPLTPLEYMTQAVTAHMREDGVQPAYTYIGDRCRVSVCRARIDETLGGVCDDGSCPGQIDGSCPFTIMDRPTDRYESVFRKNRGSDES